MPAGYWLVGETSADVREFLTGERPGSSPQGRRGQALSKMRTRISLVTEEGVEWNYLQYEGRVWNLVYRMTEDAHLQFFHDLDDAVHGDIEAFYFCPDLSESPLQVYLVRKDKDFLPQGLETPVWDGTNIIWAGDYVLPLREVSAAAYILA